MMISFVRRMPAPRPRPVAAPPACREGLGSAAWSEARARADPGDPASLEYLARF